MTQKLYFFILCLCMIFGASLGDEEKRCTIAYGKTDQCPYEIMCPADGQGVMVDYVVISNTEDCKPAHVRHSDKLNDLDKAILNTIRRECNGRKTCNFSESLRNRFTVKCDGKTYSADVMDLRYYCKPFAFNHSSVYNVNDDLISEKVQDTFYLIMATDGTNTQRSCSVRSNKNSFSFRLLNVDLEEAKSCRRQEPPVICPDTMTIEGDGQKLVTYTSKYPPEVLETHVVSNDFNINVNTSKGFVWIEFIAKDPVYLSCQDTNKDGRTTEKKTTTSTTTTTTTTPEVTTPTNSTTVDNTTSRNDATAAFNFIQESSIIRDISSTYIYIALATALVLSLCANIILCHKYCKNRKRKKENEYNYPSLENRGPNYTYSPVTSVSEDTPPSPVPRNVPDAYIDPLDPIYDTADKEYLEIQDSGGDYSFVGEHKEYSIQQDNDYSITDIKRC